MTDHPAGLIRYIGFLGSVALGIDAYLSGAFPTLPKSVTPQLILRGPNGVLIWVLWLGGTAALTGAWYFGRNLRTLTIRWTAVTAALWMLPMLVIPPIGSRDVYAYSCQGALYAGGFNPYHFGVSALPCQWLDSVSLIWRNSPTPYGPLFIMIAGVAAKLGSLTAAIIAFRLLAVVGVIGLGYALVPALRGLGVPVERGLWLVLASPLVVMHLIGGAHNDALNVMLLVAGFAVLITRFDRWHGLIIGGALAGLSVAIKPTMLVALPFMMLYASGGSDAPRSALVDPPKGFIGFPQVRPLVTRGGTVLLSAFLALCVPTAISGLGFGWISALVHAGGGIAYTSSSSAFGTVLDWLLRLVGVHIYAVPTTRNIGVMLMVIALIAAFLRGRYGDRLYACALAMLAVSFFAPFAEPWYLVWPLVFFVMTKAKARWFLISVVVACFTAMPDGVNLDNLIRLPGSIAMVVVAAFGLVAGIRWLRGAQPASLEQPQTPELAPVP
ncbi:MAG TPA: polyprenol phosphomannose-dependent alpha 1,6 mannosyltransferase MptB [Micromonosporaceae bacterium]